jgi:hypothetical protein
MDWMNSIGKMIRWFNEERRLWWKICGQSKAESPINGARAEIPMRHYWLLAMYCKAMVGLEQEVINIDPC